MCCFSKLFSLVLPHIPKSLWLHCLCCKKYSRNCYKTTRGHSRSSQGPFHCNSCSLTLKQISCFSLFDPQCRYAGIFWYPLGHVLCLHQRFVADQRAAAAGLHRWRPAFRQEAPGDGMRPQHPGQPGPHRPAPSRRPGKCGHMPPPTQVRGRSVGDWLSRKHSAASVWSCGYYTVPGFQRAEDWYLVRKCCAFMFLISFPIPAIFYSSLLLT